MKKLKQPKNSENMIIDFYFEQFSEPDDIPTITVTNYNETYEFVNGHFVDEVKRMRKNAEWLLKTADYIESKLRIK